MSDIVIGQRWVVDSEPELGLGIVVDIDSRSVTLFFECGESERRYSTQQAPLTRVRFEVEDEIQLRDGRETKVLAVHEQDGLLVYDIGNDELIIETSIASEIQLNQPLMRLLMGQLEQPKWFYFRRRLDLAMAAKWRSRLVGLLGVRASLIPHQLYIAWNACRRERVRVLLADEVGLGKTVEAGMILNRLLKFERVQRALIVVPDALQVQWLVELVRKFSITPDLYSGEEHDFHQAQIHLLPHSQLANAREKVLSGDFEITIVDEAHHLEPDSSEFECLQQLSEQSKHLVLLTATPEQLGIEKHFARLQLLDPDKFNALDDFVKEEQGYSELNAQISHLPQTRNELVKQYQLDAKLDDDALVDQLLDVHGVGRVMFRNVRAAISGFPERYVVHHVLADDEPESRFEWLAKFLNEDQTRKVLVICHELSMVKACEEYLWTRHGLDAALFHEEQDLIERDRAAAYFADMEKGSQTLICSEIGSEGRNFQFCHNLVCLDLPENPDLLEQRIGRLDRIGQANDVAIHIPYAKSSTTEKLLNWYNGTLGCIERQNPAAGKIHSKYWSDFKAGADLAEQAQKEMGALLKQIESGRDALLERNSCRQPRANELVSNIEEINAETPLKLVEDASELLQFHFDQLSHGVYSLIPSDKMLVPALPGLPPEGTELTFDREIACQREDILFLSWDSPFISGLWEMLHHSEIGSASVATLPSKQLPAGHCLLECCFDYVVQHQRSVDCLPFLSEQSIRVLLFDVGEKNLADVLPEDKLQNNLQPLPKRLARKIVGARKTEISQWFKKAGAMAELQLNSMVKTAAADVNSYFEGEQSRLQRLAAINNNQGDDSEMASLAENHKSIVSALQNHSLLQLSAIRLIVVAPP